MQHSKISKPLTGEAIPFSKEVCEVLVGSEEMFTAANICAIEKRLPAMDKGDPLTPVLEDNGHRLEAMK